MMRARVAFAFVVVAVVVAGCGSHRTLAPATVTPRPKVLHLALISARTGALLPGSPDIFLNAAVSDGLGGWFVGGGSVGLAHLLADGQLDPTWGSPLSRQVSVSLLVRSGSRLYVEDSGRVEAFDTTGTRLWVGPRVSGRVLHLVGGRVFALTASSTRVYLGGDFTRVGGALRRSLAALDARTGRLLDWRMPLLRNGDGLDATNAYVGALAFAASRLYVGGVFSAIGGHPRSGLAALDPRTGAVLSWRVANAGGDLETIFVTYGGAITAGFDSFGAFDAHTGRRLPWMSRLGGSATTFAADGPLLYLGGGLRSGFGSVAGRPRHNLAAINLATGRFTAWGPNLAPFVSVGTIVPSGKDVLVLGSFTNSIG